MLAVKAQCRLGDAKSYFEEHLCAGDYYTEGRQVLGQWYGKGAQELGLSGVTQAEEFLRLCDNLHPQTGERLTLRQKTTRKETGADGSEHVSANRRVFYDFTFSPPKSVSIAALVGHDERIVAAHERAVNVALSELEAFAATRVRKQGQCTDRTTGNIVAAVFRHETSRALDPHLHSHCILFNATHDPIEGHWKALQNHDMLVASKFIENVYYHALAQELRGFGYAIENKARGDFEIQGVTPQLIERFSKRHREIDEKTRELLEREPEKAEGNIAAIREHIAHKERARKIRDIGTSQVQTLWDGQLSPAEKASLGQLTTKPNREFTSSVEVAREAIGWAEEHLFDRRSVALEHDLWRHALEHARGQKVSLKDIRDATQRRGYLRDQLHPGKITTQDILEREWSIVCRAQDGRGKHRPLNASHTPRNPHLDAEQAQAVKQILGSTDFVTLFRGGAGTGKSYTLREIERGLCDAGHSVLVLAPQRQQVIGLEQDGFAHVQTVSSFLARNELADGAVVVVDEAGQIGGEQMEALLQLVHAKAGRVILSGDTRQHGAVATSDALRAIETFSGLVPVELTTVRRQNPDLAKTKVERRRIKEYRQAVIEASEGKLAESFNRLNSIGAIASCTFANQHEKLTACYLEHVKARHETVVVSQSWNEIHQVNEQIRGALKAHKLLGQDEVSVTTLQPIDLTDAQKRDSRSYDDQRVLVFNRSLRGFQKGDSVHLQGITDTHLLVGNDQKMGMVAFKYLDRLTVCERKEMALSSGDRLQLKTNGRSVNGCKLANGELVTVKKVDAKGRIVLADGRIMGTDFRQLVRGYAVTSYASQGKTVDYVLFSDSAVRAATNTQQWYVTISRGRKGVQVFTTDLMQLRENITRGGHRLLALELVSPRKSTATLLQSIRQRFGEMVARLVEQGRRLRRFETVRPRVITPHQQVQPVRKSTGMRV